jgi:hypothetical protein
LFWIASFSQWSIWAVRLIQSYDVFRRKPHLIPMALVERLLAVAEPLRRALILSRAATEWIRRGSVEAGPRAVILSRAAAAWILRRTVAKAFPGLIRFRSDRERPSPSGR